MENTKFCTPHSADHIFAHGHQNCTASDERGTPLDSRAGLKMHFGHREVPVSDKKIWAIYDPYR